MSYPNSIKKDNKWKYELHSFRKRNGESISKKKNPHTGESRVFP